MSLAGGPKADHKLGIKEFTVKVDLITDTGALVTVTMGATLDRWGSSHSITSMVLAQHIWSQARESATIGLVMRTMQWANAS